MNETHAVDLESLQRDGFCILRGMIPEERTAAIRQSVADTVRKHTSIPLPTGKVTGFLRLNQSLAPYLAHPRLMAIVDALFGEHPRISMLTGVINGPGIPRGQVHADWPFNQNHRSRVRAPYPDVVMNLVTIWMLTDFTPEIGATYVIPGTHKRNAAPRFGSDIDPMARYEGEIQAVGRAGDVAVFDARTWHAIAPNQTDQERVAVIVRYAPWWLNLQPLRPGTRDRKQIVEMTGGKDIQVEPVPESVYKNLPPEVQALVYHMVAEDH